MLGVAFVCRQNGAVIEADVALNPAKAWTLDPIEATTRGGAYSFKEVMTHEIGHMWGLKHPFETQKTGWDSVMQYKFPPGVAIRDGLVSSYVTYWEHPDAELATYAPAAPRSSNVKRGGSFSLNGSIKVENAGTVPLANSKVEVYLVPKRFSFEGAVLVKRLRLAGILWLGYYLRDPKDRYPANNGAWSNADVTLTVK